MIKTREHLGGTYTKEFIELAAKEYRSGKSIGDISREYNVDRGAISSRLKLAGVKVLQRRIAVNEDFFASIDSEKKAYWLGFIMADGSIGATSKQCSKPNRLSINISAIDKDHLILFCKDLETDPSKISTIIPKGTYSENPISRISINSTRMCDNLLTHGVFPNKSLKVRYPRIPLSLDNHFIRGYFDGNGSTYSPGDDGIVINFSITSNKELLYAIQNKLVTNVGVSRTKLSGYPHKTVPVFDLRYGGRIQVPRILKYLYKDAQTYLSRKYDKNLIAISS